MVDSTQQLPNDLGLPYLYEGREFLVLLLIQNGLLVVQDKDLEFDEEVYDEANEEVE